MDRGRLFGAAVAKVKELPRQQRSIRTVRMRSDVRPSQSSRTILKVGGRLGGNRKVIALSDPSVVRQTYNTIRRRREGFVSEPYEALNERRSSDDGRWSHDMYEGDAAGNPGSEAFVRNLPHSVTKQQLVKLFDGVGEVVSVKIDSGPLTTARIAFVKKNSAAEAAERLHGYKFQGRPIKVSEFHSLDSWDAERRVSQEDMDDNMAPRPRRVFLRRATTSTSGPLLISDVPQRSVFDRLS